MNTVLLQLLVTGVAMGFVYTLVAIEYTLVFNACGLLNFSHGAIIQLGGYVFVGTCLAQLGMENFPASALAIILLGGFGFLMAISIFIPLRTRSALIALVATSMLGEVLSKTEILVWGPVAIRPKNFLSGVINIGGAIIPRSYIFIIIISLVLLVILQLIMNHTKVGLGMTCVKLNRTAASLMGVNVKNSISVSIAISCMICCVIGIVMSPVYTIYDGMSNMISLKGFCAGVIGGFGNLPTAVVGGLLIGIVESLVSMALPAVYKDVIAFLLMILFLLFFPGGFAEITSNIKKRLSKRRRGRYENVIGQ